MKKITAMLTRRSKGFLLTAMLSIPFGLYHAANAGMETLVLFLLAALALCMIAAVRFG